MIGRIIWFAALLAIAVVTIAVQLDRQSARDPRMAVLVPGPFRAFAQTHIAAAAAEGRNPLQALEEARLLIRRRPVPAEHLTLLAVAQAQAGMADEAAFTIQAAAQRGWREPVAQEAVLRLALAAGDQPEAARRYTALLLLGATPDALLQELGPEVAGEAGGPGRATITAIVSATERWQPIFLRRGASTMPPDAFAEIVTQSIAQGADLDCGVLEQTMKAFARRDPEAARSLEAAVAACRQG